MVHVGLIQNYYLLVWSIPSINTLWYNDGNKYQSTMLMFGLNLNFKLHNIYCCIKFTSINIVNLNIVSIY